MAVTPFLKLQKPPFDTIPWDEAVNGNMDTIDAFISRYMAVPNYVGAWVNSTNYVSGQNVLDIVNATIYLCQVTHMSSALPTTFAQDRTTYPTYWAATTNVVSGSIALTIAEATPLSAKAGDLWWNSAEGQLYILYNDGNSLQWVVANNQSGNIGDAPRDGNIYGRQMGAWVGSVNSQDVGRNKLHNGLFTVAQRGVGPFTTAGGMSLDRWSLYFNLDTLSIQQTTLSDADRTQLGDESAKTCVGAVFAGNAGAAAQSIFSQAMEDVRRFAGKTVIVSFWAKYTSGTPRLGVCVAESFGTGGSPSASVYTPATPVTLSATWQRYSVSVALPSISGKTVGTAGNDFTQLIFVFSHGASLSSTYGGVGVQSGTVALWGVQLEIAAPGQTQPSPLEKLDPRMELSNCQRFYQVGYVGTLAVATGAQAFGQMVTFPVQMRAIPTITPGALATNVNVTGGVAVDTFLPYAARFYVSSTAAGAVQFTAPYTASADL